MAGRGTMHDQWHRHSTSGRTGLPQFAGRACTPGSPGLEEDLRAIERARPGRCSGGGKLMRILQRQPDGSWKMHRTMTVGDPASE